jgi:hypothetical protein
MFFEGLQEEFVQRAEVLIAHAVRSNEWFFSRFPLIILSQFDKTHCGVGNGPYTGLIARRFFCGTTQFFQARARFLLVLGEFRRVFGVRA